MFEKRVTYILQKDDRYFIIEGVPVRVNEETGEQLFTPETVEKLQAIIWEQKEPVREVTTSVHEFPR